MCNVDGKHVILRRIDKVNDGLCGMPAISTSRDGILHDIHLAPLIDYTDRTTEMKHSLHHANCYLFIYLL